MTDSTRRVSRFAINPLRRRVTALAGALALACAAGAATPAMAQEAYPSRTVNIVIGFPPGSATDGLARMLADRLSAQLGQQFVVINRPGMGGGIGAGSVARADPDGYTLLVGATAPISINPHVYPNTNYDPLKDFEPIGPLAWVPMMLVAGPGVEATTLAELLSAAKKKPGLITFASSGNGTTSHLTMEILSSQAGVEFSHIPYKGSAQSQVDIISGQVGFAFETLASSLTMAKAGKLKPLGVSSSNRNHLFPDVPTVAEQGFPDFDIVAWTGLFAPAGTPAPILDKLADALSTATAEPKFKEDVMRAGNEVRAAIPRAEFAAFLKKDYERWGDAVKKFNVKTD